MSGESGARQATDVDGLLSVAAALVRRAKPIGLAAVCAGAIAVVVVLLLPARWESRALIVPAVTEPSGASGLLSLAGELGVNIGGRLGSPLQSPLLLRDLVTSRAILAPLLADSVLLQAGAPPRPILELLGVDAIEPGIRFEEGLEALRERIHASASRTSAALQIVVQADRPELAHHVALRLVSALNELSREVGQAQARQERQFSEERLRGQRESVRTLEARLVRFQEQNRQFQSSASQRMEFDRLQRELALQQQVLVRLAQSFEEARLAEVRDVPVLVAVDAPALPARPVPRGVLIALVAGMLLGGAGAASGVALSHVRARWRGSPTAEGALVHALDDLIRRPMTGDQVVDPAPVG